MNREHELLNAFAEALREAFQEGYHDWGRTLCGNGITGERTK